MMREISHSDIARLDSLLGETSRVCMVTHAHPDGDALGSALGMARYLYSCRNIECRLILDDGWSHFLSFLFTEEELQNTVIRERDGIEAVAGAFAESGLIVCTDFNTPDRAGDGIGTLIKTAGVPKVVIDHHLYPDRECFDLVFSETEISSASELAFCVLKMLPDIGGNAANLPADALTAFATGITTDTNNFANSVFPETLNNYSELLAAGIDRQMILDALYNQCSENRVRAFGDLLGRHMRITAEGLAYIVVDEERYKGYGLVSGDTEGLVNIPLTIKEVRMSIFLRQEGGVWRVSIRSKRGTSAYLMAREHFNGGGHELAAGGKIEVSDGMRTAGDMEKYIIRCAQDFFGH